MEGGREEWEGRGSGRRTEEKGEEEPEEEYIPAIARERTNRKHFKDRFTTATTAAATLS